MPDHLTPEKRRRAMQQVKTKDGPLEVAVRSALHRKGYRFRKHLKTLPGRPDVVFTRRKVAVFIDGDFWHGVKGGAKAGQCGGVKVVLPHFW